MFAKASTQTVLLLCAGSLLGVLIGVGAGNAAIERQQQTDAAQLASLYMQRADSIDTEAQQALESIDASTDAPCSEADLANLRKIVILSHALKSASRLDGRQILCSSTLGRVSEKVDLPQPDFVTPEGRRVFFNAPLYGIPNTNALALEWHNAGVIINPNAYSASVDVRMDYSVIAGLPDNKFLFISSGNMPDLAHYDIVDGRPIHVEGRRFEVQCSAAHSGCIVAAFSHQEVTLSSPVLIGFGSLGLLAGLGGSLGLSVLLTRARSLGRRLRTALRSGALTVEYQPLARLSDGTQAGAEALVRWQDSSDSMVSPDVFIALAEQEGFISEVTRFVFKRVVEELGECLIRHPEFHVTINISTQDLLDPKFCPFVAHLLRIHNVSPESIGFELTERSTANRNAINNGILPLRAAGHRIYIDDFGSDYSSLSYLAELQVDGLKLDRTFTQSATSPSGSIVPQVVAMADSLGLRLVFEGIETREQASYYYSVAPDALGQGWLFGRPEPATEIIRQLDAPAAL